jgi:ABC-type transport system involved in multi-copper enzyme maturation permease subunit
MIWLTLRQHRAQLIGLLAVAVLVTVTTWLFADYALRTRAELGVDACLTSGGQSSVFGGSCAAVFAEFQRRLGPVSWLFIAIYLAPALAASYIGGPLFAAEFERATHRLAWTQGISRLRWAAVKLGVVLAVALIATVILAAAVGPTRVLMGIGRSGAGVRPFDGFDFEAPVLVSYVVFGIAVAACTGAWSRRILAGMFVGLLVFGIARFAVYTVRPSYQAPITVPYENLSLV